MARVKYTYDGSTATATTANFSGGEETTQDAVDATNLASYISTAKQATIVLGAIEARDIMEVI